MNVTAKLDRASVESAIRRIADLQGRPVVELLREEAGLFVRDAMRFTPPFSSAPIMESGQVQKRKGEHSVRRDIRRAFEPLDSIRVAAKDTPLGAAIRRLIRKGDMAMAQILLARIGIRTLGVIKTAERELHERLRDRRGRVGKDRKGYIVERGRSIATYIKTRLRMVGLAKSGWLPALNSLGRKVPGFGWVEKHRGQGWSREGGSRERPFVEVANAVPYIQKEHAHIMGRAQENRARNAPIRLRKIEEGLRRKARKMGLM